MATSESKEIIKRLDAIIRLIVEMNSDKDKFEFKDVIPLLKSVGLEPTEIAKILGKKSRTDITQYLYSKNKSTKPTKASN